MSESESPNDSTASGATHESRVAGELRDLFKSFAQPVIDTIDTKLRGQIDTRVDDRVNEKVTEILADRLSVLERAIADLDRTVRALQERLDSA